MKIRPEKRASRGRPRIKEAGTKVTLYLGAKTIDQLDEIAREQRRSKSVVVELLVDAYFNSRPTPPANPLDFSAFGRVTSVDSESVVMLPRDVKGTASQGKKS